MRTLLRDSKMDRKNKKTVVEINSFNFGSTGNIMLSIAESAREHGYEVFTFNAHGNTQKRDIQGNYTIGNHMERQLCSKINYFTGMEGALNYLGTLRFLSKLDEINPSIIHFHNLHSNYINLKMLFRYIQKRSIKVIWTLHDCFAFTGHCPYFDIAQCEKWKKQCYDCPMIRKYPAKFRDTSAKEYIRKKRIFTSIQDMTIVTPSMWLANHVSNSFLSKYPIKVINNGIDLKMFCPRNSAFRKEYHLENKFIILGVAMSWGERKGQDRFEWLAEKLDERFQIVLVGISQAEIGTEEIICIKRTESQQQLAEIYTSADLFLNPTREDNFPTVNIESLACGTAVLSYGAGGSAEAFDENSGRIVSDENVLDVLNRLYEKNYDVAECVRRGRQFGQDSKWEEYIVLYDEVLKV